MKILSKKVRNTILECLNSTGVHVVTKEQLKVRVEEKLKENDSVGSFHIQPLFDEHLANKNKLVIDGDNVSLPRDEASQNEKVESCPKKRKLGVELGGDSISSSIQPSPQVETEKVNHRKSKKTATERGGVQIYTRPSPQDEADGMIASKESDPIEKEEENEEDEEKTKKSKRKKKKKKDNEMKKHETADGADFVNGGNEIGKSSGKFLAFLQLLVYLIILLRDRYRK